MQETGPVYVRYFSRVQLWRVSQRRAWTFHRAYGPSIRQACAVLMRGMAGGPWRPEYYVRYDRSELKDG